MNISIHETIGLPIMSNQGAGGSRQIAHNPPTTSRRCTEALASRSDTIELSSQAGDVQHIQRILLQTPEIREHRIAEAMSAVEQGALNLDGLDLAGRVLSDPLHTVGATA